MIKAQKKFTFPKRERLSSKKKIEELFRQGSSFFSYPIRIKYLEDSSSDYNQVVITVPRRYFKKAVDRNRIKRQLREAYRLNKYIVAEETETRFLIAIMYLSAEQLPFIDIEDKLIRLLRRLTKNKIKG